MIKTRVIVKRIYQSVFLLLKETLPRSQFLILAAIMIGFIAGMAAVLMKTVVHKLQHFVSDPRIFHYGYIAFPAVGLALCSWIVRRFYHDKLEKGFTMVLRAISRNSAYIPLKHTYAHIVTSSITMAFGGSVGLEAPIVATGAAIGNNVARIDLLNYKDRVLFTACGAAAGIAAVFNAPVAGVIFAMEVLLPEATVSYFIPLIIASVVGTLCSSIILQESILFNFALRRNFDYHNVPLYIVLGIFCGLYALYFSSMFHWSEHAIKAKYKTVWKRVLFAGTILAALTLILPPLFGEGYETIKDLANGNSGHTAEKLQFINLEGHDWWLFIFLGLVVFLKPIASGATIGGGGNGGVFAPSLFSGSIIGFLFASLFNKLGLNQLPVGNFCLVAMAGLLSGVMYCPLSAIFLIAEITNGYTLFIPLMIVSSLSFFIARRRHLISKEAEVLEKEGNYYSQRKEHNIWNTMALEELIKTDYPVLSVDDNLGTLVEAITKTDKQVVAIKDKKGKFLGIIDLNKIKQLLYYSEHQRNVPLKTLYKPVGEVFYLNTPVMDFINHIDRSNNWYLPVLDNDDRFIGFISRTILFDKFRETMNQDDSGF